MTGTAISAGAGRRPTRSETAWFFDGRIEQVCYWKRVLTAAERTDLYNAGNGRDWPFN